MSQNELAQALSPYLRQHAGNPVHWREWNDAALRDAQSSQKPILLSIGYSACHWCHVMERESFENDAIASLMNQNYICIKVDREERPDLDSVYMSALIRLTGQGGWPMTLFLTPDGLPFYGGTYYPPEDTGRQPGFPRVLESVQAAWRDRQTQVQASAQQLQNEVAQMLQGRPSVAQPSQQTLTNVLNALIPEFDHQWGGFGGAPKFPPAMTLSFLLQYYQRTGNASALHMTMKTLMMMSAGGMYDQIGGGFHRYSVDARWEVPHFEKMLYDNGLLLQSYTQAFRSTRDSRGAMVCADTAQWLINDMQHPLGGFYSALDADSDGEEGTYYVWSADELQTIFGSDRDNLARIFRCDGPPTFEDKYVLQRQFATAEDWPTVFSPSNRIVYEASVELLLKQRRERTKPFCDRKVIPAWNALVISGLIHAGMTFSRPEWIRAAERAYNFIMSTMTIYGTLRRVWLDGQCGTVLAFLEDHANLAIAALDLHRVTGRPEFLHDAMSRVTFIIKNFLNDDTSLLYDTSLMHEQLVVRPSDRNDNATPSGTASTCVALMKLAAIYDDSYYVYLTERLLAPYTDSISRWPAGYGGILQALDLYVGSVMMCIVAGPLGTLIEYVRAALPAHAVILHADVHADLTICAHKIAVNNLETVYICIDTTCSAPLTSLRAIEDYMRQSIGHQQ